MWIRVLRGLVDSASAKRSKGRRFDSHCTLGDLTEFLCCLCSCPVHCRFSNTRLVYQHSPLHSSCVLRGLVDSASAKRSMVAGSIPIALWGILLNFYV